MQEQKNRSLLASEISKEGLDRYFKKDAEQEFVAMNLLQTKC